MVEDDLVHEINALESRVDQLAGLAERLLLENQQLQERYDQLHRDRAKVLRQQEQAHNRVESMITQLRSMEQQ